MPRYSTMYTFSEMSGEYGCSQEELTKFMEYRGRDAHEQLRSQYGDVNELCRRLKTSPTEGKRTYFFLFIV